MRTIAFCEIEPYCRAVLRKHWPDVPIFEDIRKLTAGDIAGPVDVVCGGFPCQDLSVAGKQAGIAAERSGLWSEFARLIGEIRPRYAIVENVPNLLAGPSEQPGQWFGRILGDLAALRYDAEWDSLPASAFGAPFLGDRVFIVAAAHESDGPERLGDFFHGARAVFSEIAGKRPPFDLDIWLAPASKSFGGNVRVPDFVDRRERTAALGNAVVPQIPESIGRSIMEAEKDVCGHLQGQD